MKSYISLIIACYNEAEHLEDSLPRIASVLKKLKNNFELIIIDDCSLDNTTEIIEEFIKNNKSLSIQYVKHKKNIGRGGTVTEGIMRARGEIVGFIDIDLEISPDYIPEFLEIIDTKKADIVVGKRHYPFLFASLHRHIASRAYSWLVQLILKLPISDTEAGYKFFNRRKILPILRKVRDVKWFWDTEIIAMSTEEGLKISEIDVLFERRKDKTSTVHIFKDSFQYLISLIEYKATHILRSNGISIGNKIYFFLRFLMLPVSEIDAVIPRKGKILDIGCGIGSLSFFLAASSKKRIVFGWDIDKLRISAAQKVIKNMPNIKFEVKNALDIARVEGLSGIVVSDVLHHINFFHQEELIKKISKALGKNGVFVIKEVDNDQRVRALLSLFWDRVFYPNETSYFRTKDDWTRLFKKNGFLTEIKKTMWWFPGSQTLFICKKK